MNDREAQELLRGIDAPRPLPRGLRDGLEDALVSGLAAIDAARPLPVDLRARLEATLVGGTPMPATVRRRVLTASRRPSPRVLQVAAVVAAVALLAGILAALGLGDDTGTTVAGPPGRQPRSSATTTSPGGAASTGTSSAPGAPASPPFVSGRTATPAAGSSSDAASPSGAASGTAGSPSAAGTPIVIQVVGGATNIAAGFDAYIRTLNASGGINGRPITSSADSAGSVATINVGGTPLGSLPPEVVFETAFVDEARLRGPVMSFASPIERQARLAVDHALASDPTAARAAIYTGDEEPWASIVPTALEEALRQHGVTAVRVPFGAGVPVFVDADMSFLSLDTDLVGAWVGDANAPSQGVWALGSGWDDRVARMAADKGVRVLSPYAPVEGAERDALVAGLGDRPLSAGAVHGWVTGKGLALLLTRNNGHVLSEADLDALVGWDPQWAPPYEVRRGTRARTPDAIELIPTRDGFVPRGAFERGG